MSDYSDATYVFFYSRVTNGWRSTFSRLKLRDPVGMLLTVSPSIADRKPVFFVEMK